MVTHTPSSSESDIAWSISPGSLIMTWPKSEAEGDEFRRSEGSTRTCATFALGDRVEFLSGDVGEMRGSDGVEMYTVQENNFSSGLQGLLLIVGGEYDIVNSSRV